MPKPHHSRILISYWSSQCTFILYTHTHTQREKQENGNVSASPSSAGMKLDRLMLMLGNMTLLCEKYMLETQLLVVASIEIRKE